MRTARQSTTWEATPLRRMANQPTILYHSSEQSRKRNARSMLAVIFIHFFKEDDTMAKTIPYRNKDGKIVSYQIQVSRGYDSSGKKLKPFCESWKVPESFKSEKAIQNALKKEIGRFEAECNSGNHFDDKRTFQEYAEYYMKLSTRDNKLKTSKRYKNDLKRVNPYIGDIRLVDLTPADINKMYLELQKPGVRKDLKAIAKDPEHLKKLKSAMFTLNKDLCAAAGVSDATLRSALTGKRIAVESAEKIASALQVKPESVFDFITLGDDSTGLSGKTIHNYHDMIHVILQCAEDEGVIKKNPASSAKPPTVEKKEAEFFEIEDILKIRNALDHIEPQFEKYKIMIYLLIDLGIRKGELTGICRKDIDWDTNTIEICHNIQWDNEIGLYDDTPKNGKGRDISVSDEVMSALHDYIAKMDKYAVMMYGSMNEYNKLNQEGYIFVQDDFIHVMNPSSLNHWLINFEQKYNLPHIYPHKFRHSQASLLYASNIDAVTISKRLGHAQVSTTQNIYSHLMKGQDQKASNAIANKLYSK